MMMILRQALNLGRVRARLSLQRWFSTRREKIRLIRIMMNMMMILRMMIMVILIINDHIDFLKIDFDHYQMLEPTDSLPVTGAETAADH